MRLILFGHRGVGKSSLLDRFKSYSPVLTQENCLCIDTLIEKRCGKTIKNLVAEKGEAFFRKQEKNMLVETSLSFGENDSAVLALGAGYIGAIPQGWKVLWLQRGVNPSEFKFTDRPSLSEDGSLGLPIEKFLEREKRYSDLADFELELLEHRSDYCPSEELFLAHLFEKKPLQGLEKYFVTVLCYFSHNLEVYSQLFSQCGLELRDDFIENDQMRQLIEGFNGPVIVSFRNSMRAVETHHLVNFFSRSQQLKFDWPIEWGSCPYGKPDIWSLHRREKTLDETFRKISNHEGVLKLAVPIFNFHELRQGYQWFLEDPKNRVFLPSSDGGRWKWFRQITASKMPFSFVRTGKGSSPDQPTMLETIRFDPKLNEWGAILGSPIEHSLTPWFQHGQFGNSLSVDLQAAEWSEALPFLYEMGLRKAAVTSPLKEKAFEWIENKDEWKCLSAINTIVHHQEKWIGANTDHEGLVELLKEVSSLSKEEVMEPLKIAIWGGGGTLSVLRSHWPNASFYSSRSGEIKEGRETSPDIIIWAVGFEHFSREGCWPPKDWSPQLVIDLNYSDNSPGINCAHEYGCQYTSGLGMFIAQGEAQKEFWKRYEC